MEISDESPLAGFTVNDPNSGQYIYSDVIRNDADQTYSNGRYHYTATVDMNRVSGGSNNKPYVLAWDYGLNHSKATTIGTATGNDGGNIGYAGGAEYQEPSPEYQVLREPPRTHSSTSSTAAPPHRKSPSPSPCATG